MKKYYAEACRWGVNISYESMGGGAFDFFDGDELTKEDLLRGLLNGAKDWKEYSYGGLSFIYDSDICERLCTPSEAKRKRNGELQPNSQETWLDVQARALYQAARLLMRINK